MTAAICPAPACCSPVTAGKFLCRPHWFALPKPLRDEVWRTWKAYRSARSSEAMAAYRAARDQAIAHLGGEDET